MVWTVRFTERARKELKKLDRTAQARITAYLDANIAGSENPRRYGGVLHGDKRGYWKYRIGDYRVICSIDDGIVVVLVLNVGHRREVYR